MCLPRSTAGRAGGRARRRTLPGMTEPSRPPSPSALRRALRRARDGVALDETEATVLLAARGADLDDLLSSAARVRDAGLTAAGRPGTVTYSRKVFIPLTHLCRDRCHYCTFATIPNRLAQPFLSVDEVLDIARQGAALGCKEALFTLGDRPEDRWPAARDWLDSRGYGSTLDYVRACAIAVLEQTGLLPHLNPGVLTWEDLARLKPVAPSMGMMLETSASRLWSEPGGPHFASPDKEPPVRLRVLEDAGRQAVPFTTGILVGIGETPAERVDSLFAIRRVARRYGGIQEVIVQNFRAKPDTAMRAMPDAELADLAATVAVARLALGPSMRIQAPPNLLAGEYALLLRAGIDDWGGVSPLTPDHVNPEQPWPQIDELARGSAVPVPRAVERLRPEVAGALRRAADDPAGISDAEALTLFDALPGAELDALAALADNVRRDAVGDEVTYVVNRNINFTNVCYTGCRFCAFAQRRTDADAYTLSLAEVGERAEAAWDVGATEVCLQGGIHPDLPGSAYFEIAAEIKRRAPDLHVHAFSPMEIVNGATRTGLSVRDWLAKAKDAGLDSIPGTAAEILDDDVRWLLTKGKLPAAAWVNVVTTAHRVGIPSTATMMYGHVDTPTHWVAHLRLLARIQGETGGFTEFVPLPFVHQNSPIYLAGLARPGPTVQENRAVHAMARLLLHGRIDNIQCSWVKLGEDGCRQVLAGGVNDLGGTLMEETISRMAGSGHGSRRSVLQLEALAASAGRPARQRTTAYGEVSVGRPAAARRPPALLPLAPA